MIQFVSKLSGKSYGQDHDTDYAIRVICEHVRSATFLIGDGVVPGNYGRDYVLRRLIRRAIRYGKWLGMTGSFLPKVSEKVVEKMGSDKLTIDSPSSGIDAFLQISDQM